MALYLPADPLHEKFEVSANLEEYASKNALNTVINARYNAVVIVCDFETSVRNDNTPFIVACRFYSNKSTGFNWLY